MNSSEMEGKCRRERGRRGKQTGEEEVHVVMLLHKQLASSWFRISSICFLSSFRDIYGGRREERFILISICQICQQQQTKQNKKKSRAKICLEI